MRAVGRGKEDMHDNHGSLVRTGGPVKSEEGTRYVPRTFVLDLAMVDQVGKGDRLSTNGILHGILHSPVSHGLAFEHLVRLKVPRPSVRELVETGTPSVSRDEVSRS